MSDAPQDTTAFPRPTGERPLGVLVGVDGSEQSVSAAKWAQRQATARNLPLTLVTAYTVPVFWGSSLEAGVNLPDDAGIRGGVQEVLDGVAAQLDPELVTPDTRVAMGDAAGVLVELSKEAEVLVSGSRGRGGFLGRLLGSVSSALPSHAHCPVVIVPAGEHGTRAGDDAPVAVGLDGSEQGRVAALHAAEEAAARQSPLKLVCAMPPVSGTVAWLPSTVDEQALVDEIKENLNRGADWLRQRFPGLEVLTEVVDGTPVDVMVDQSATARLTVVGTRGLGGFSGALMGSTSQGVVHHAKGPVMVVPYTEDDRLDTADDDAAGSSRA